MELFPEPGSLWVGLSISPAAALSVHPFQAMLGVFICLEGGQEKAWVEILVLPSRMATKSFQETSYHTSLSSLCFRVTLQSQGSTWVSPLQKNLLEISPSLLSLWYSPGYNDHEKSWLLELFMSPPPSFSIFPPPSGAFPLF